MIEQLHKNDDEGHPAGGSASGVGLAITWQNGPLGQSVGRKLPNGAQVEDVIEAAIGRLEFFQDSDFACDQNNLALIGLRSALDNLNLRTKDREARAVEGTHAQ